MSLDKFLSDGENLVVKIGGGVLDCDGAYYKMALKIRKLAKTFPGRIYTVVSAMKGKTNELHDEIPIKGDNAATAEYLIKGEFESANEFKKQLNAVGVESDIVFQGKNTKGYFPITANGSYLDAEVDLDHSLEKSKRFFQGLGSQIVVIPGYGAENRSGETVLLGRNASDVVAALVGWLDKDAGLVVYMKEVDGIFENFGSDYQLLISSMSLNDFKARDYGKVLHKKVADYAGCDFFIQNGKRTIGSLGTHIWRSKC